MMTALKLALMALLLTVCGAAVAAGMYATQGNLKSRIHRVCMLMALCLVPWALGLAITMAASDEAVCAIGRRLAPLGWGLTASASAHFFLLLTGRENALNRWWALPALYLPAAVTILGYSVLPLFGLNQDSLTLTGLGWANASRTDFWDIFYYAQVAAFMALCLWLLLSWGARANDPHVKKQARLLAAAAGLAAVLSALTDVLPLLLGLALPQMSAIFLLLPIFGVSYCIKKYHFLQAAEGPSELILSESKRTLVYRNMSFAAYAISAALLACKNLYAPGTPWPPILALGAFWVLSGTVHTLINRARTDDRTKEMLEAVHFAFLIPVASLWFEEIGVAAIWAIVFPMIIFSLLNNQHIMLTTVIVSSLLTQLVVWAYKPVSAIEVGASLYFARLAIMAFAAGIGLYVHSIYTGRLRENVGLMEMQRVVSEVSQEFITVGEQNFEEKLDQALRRCGEYIRCDRAYLILIDEGGESIRFSREWLAPGVPSQIKQFEASIKEMYPMMLRQLREENVVILKDAKLLPPMAGKARKMLRQQGIRALVTLPIQKQDEIIGFLGFNAGRPFRKWNLESTPFLEIVSGIVTDAVLKADSEREINFIAYHDLLTRLPNRILFQDRLQQAVQLSLRTGQLIGVVFADLDSFKYINDTMGHGLGDQLLVETARRLTGALRRYDTVARFGGDEFMLVLNQLSGSSDLIRVMDHLMEAVRQPVVLSGQEFFVTMSAGVARFPADGQDAETLIKNADTAMYSAKAMGKNRYELCSQDMKDEVLERMRLSNLLYHALEKEQLTLYYQPQLDIERRSIVGMEALLRWNLPGRGMVGPLTFIPLAEQTGLIQPIGEWVLRTACLQNRRWQRMGFPALRMAVNMSVQQLKNPGFVQTVAGVLADTGLYPECLELEITESVANGNTENMVAILKQLKELGVSISIDDFGTEYSSLSRLKLLPVDRIKMDMQFVQGIESSEKDQAITKVIINLAKSLNIKVIAEGVETAPQMDYLSSKMCDEVQGYFLYRPMPAEKIDEILLRSAQALDESRTERDFSGNSGGVARDPVGSVRSVRPAATDGL